MCKSQCTIKNHTYLEYGTNLQHMRQKKILRIDNGILKTNKIVLTIKNRRTFEKKSKIKAH